MSYLTSSTSVVSFNLYLLVTAPVFESYHLHVALQFADAGSLALGGAHVAQVMDGDGGTDAGVQLSDCGGRRQESDWLFVCGCDPGSDWPLRWTDRCAARRTLCR